MSSPEKYGKLRLAVRMRSTAWLVAGWTALAAFVALLIFEIATRRRISIVAILPIMLILVRLLHPQVRFFENGVEIPFTQNNQRRFLEWGQIDHYSWDGNKLTLAETQYIPGDTVTISRLNKTRVELLLAEKLGRPIA
jgi:hypothetical protein